LVRKISEKKGKSKKGEDKFVELEKKLNNGKG